MSLGRLIIIGTPIGNLSDLSPRAREALAAADLVAAEDTRRTGLLLQHLGLKKPFLSYQKFNEASRESALLDRLRAGQAIALVTDGGMPGVSDPGERIIRAARRENLPVEVIPGPSAVLHALVASGLPALPFYFGGFLPPKPGPRKKELSAAAGVPVVISFTPHLAPMSRGIHSTIFTKLASGISPEAILPALQAAYADEPFVRVSQNLPDTKNTTGTNFCDISVRFDARTGRLILLSVEDNLVKGAAGQAVQNFNLMAGLPETTGLL